MAGTISDKAMLVRLVIGEVASFKHDRNVSEEVLASKNAERRSGKFNKKIISSPHLDTFRKNANAARTYHYQHTLPWMDGGLRVLPSALFFEYRQEMSKYKNSAVGYVDDFIKDFPRAKESAKVRLGHLYNDDDYPDPESLRRKFRLEYRFMPIPRGEDWRVDLNDDDIRLIKEDIENQVQAAANESMADVRRRLTDCLEKLYTSLDDDGKIFRNSLIGNAVELVELIPKLNITNDKELDNYAKELKQKFGSVNPDSLRDDPKLRKNKANEAKDILKRMGFRGNA